MYRHSQNWLVFASFYWNSLLVRWTENTEKSTGTSSQIEIHYFDPTAKFLIQSLIYFSLSKFMVDSISSVNITQKYRMKLFTAACQ
jgi:hypothetical protein